MRGGGAEHKGRPDRFTIKIQGDISGFKWIIRGKSRSVSHYNRLKLPLEGKKACSQLVKGGKI